MKRLTGSLAAALVLTGLGALAATGGSERRTTPVLGLREARGSLEAFRNARIVVSPERTIESGTLLVEDGRVRDVGRDVRIPRGARVRDLGGKTIYPGFVDPFTEYGLPAVEREDASGGRRGRGPSRDEGTRVGANAWNDAIHAESDWTESFAPDAKAAKPLLSRGVTTAFSVRKDGILRGRGFVASLGEGLPNDLILRAKGPHAAAFDKGSSRQDYPSSLMGSIALLRQTFLDARWYADAQAAWARDPSRPRPEVNRALEALSADPGPIVFETEDELSLLRAARIGEEFGLSLIPVGSNREYRRLDEIAALGRPIILPLVFPETPSVGTPEDEREVSLATLRHWERAPGNAAALEAKGVTFAFTGHGLERDAVFLSNLRRAVRRGLSARAALAALTTVPAELLGVADQVGTLEPGKRADFSIADGDLLASRDARIWSVFVGGRPVEEIVPLDQRDFRGSWNLTLDGKDYRLTLRGKIDEARGRLAMGEKSVSLEAVRTTRDAMTFTADLGRLGAEGVARFRLAQSGDTPRAEVVLPDGRAIATTIARGQGREDAEDESRERERSDEEAGRETIDAGPLVSHLTHPSGAFGRESPPQREDVLVRNATIWTSDEAGVIENADLLVRDGKVAKVGRGLEAPRGVRVIDATGKHVTAGIIDEHSHLAIERGVNEGSHAVTSEVRIGDVVDPEDVGIYRALAGGTTTAHLLHGSANPIGGQCQVIKLRWGLPPEQLKFEDAPPTIKFALGENVKQSNSREPTTRYPQSRMGVETIMRDAFLAARDYGEERAAYAALRPAEKAKAIPPRRDLRLEALLEILEGKRFTHIHSYVQTEILMMMRLAEELGFRVQTFTHILEGYKVAPEMAAHGTSASAFSDWWAYKFEVYDAIPYNTCLLHDAGVVTSVNSDSPDLIRRLNQEAAKSVMYCGMGPEEALELATINPALQLRVADRIGSLAPGKDADFVIWNGPPLSAYSRAEQTWVDGVPYFDIETDRAMREAAEKEKRALVQKALRMAGGPKRGGPDAERRGPRIWHCDDVEDTWRDDE